MRRTHWDDAELNLLVQLQFLLLDNFRHVEVELRVLSAFDESRVFREFNHNTLVRKTSRDKQLKQGLVCSSTMSPIQFNTTGWLLKVLRVDVVQSTLQRSRGESPRRSLAPLWSLDGWRC